MALLQHTTEPGLVNGQHTTINENSTRLAALNPAGQVQIYTRSDDMQHWHRTAEWQTASTTKITEAAWAHSEHGNIIACASEDGIISIWQQSPDAPGQSGAWHQSSRLAESVMPVTSLQFAPKQLGLQLAASSQDGFVRLYQANRPLDPDKWHLSNDLQVSTSGEPCTYVSWRQHTFGLPAMLCTGTSQAAHIYYYRPRLGDWVRAASLDTAGRGVTALHWAPALGRPKEFIAAACGDNVLVWSLQGKAHDLKIKQMACLDVDGEAWKLKFAKFGSLLAASAAGTNGSSVYVWELRPTESEAATWVLQTRIAGGISANGDQAMLDG